MKIDLISDLHGFYPTLEGGDLLIVVGDLTARHSEEEHFEFIEWLEKQSYKKIIVIAGNHDTYIEKEECFGIADFDGQNIEYLQDSGTEFEGLKVWGSPWSLKFKGMNPHCMAFTCDTEEELAEKFALIPDDVDILITHSPPFGILDLVRDHGCNCAMDCMKPVGSTALREVLERINPKLHVFGHTHENGGQITYFKRSGHGVENNTIMVNASHVNELYKPVNKPVQIFI